jgi:XTP/dITP diphosphohydrolase
MRLIVASNNPGKLVELRALLPPVVELLSLADAGVQLPPETGDTFVANALLKARAAAMVGAAAIADDSGLEVDALGGRPGVRSARFAGPRATDEQNNGKLLAELSASAAPGRSARFRSAVALVTPDGRTYVACGTVEGQIVDVPRGSGGFGYDPLFEIHDAGAPEATGKTMAEIGLAEKNRISHRARAYRELIAELERCGVDLTAMVGAAPRE